MLLACLISASRIYKKENTTTLSMRRNYFRFLYEKVKGRSCINIFSGIYRFHQHIRKPPTAIHNGWSIKFTNKRQVDSKIDNFYFQKLIAWQKFAKKDCYHRKN